MSAGKPKIVPQRSKGSVVSTTYEFPYQRQAEVKTLRQIIYDGENGKVLGRTPKNWGKKRYVVEVYVCFDLLQARCL
jgi:hypothetical protein